MKEELTTRMHSEFMEKEHSAEEMAALGVFGMINKGISLDKALAKYGISESRYKELCEKLGL